MDSVYVFVVDKLKYMELAKTTSEAKILHKYDCIVLFNVTLEIHTYIPKE